MKRWHEDLHIIVRQWRKHRRMHVESNKTRFGFAGQDPYEVDCRCDDEISRFRKKDAYDCGKAKCKVCHADKFPWRRSTVQETTAEVSFPEQLSELRTPNSAP